MKTRALSQHYRDQAQAERDWLRAEAERLKQAEAIVPDITPSHAEIVREFQQRQAEHEHYALPKHVEGARYRVRFRYQFDKWEQVRHFVTASDRAAFCNSLRVGAVLLRTWEA